MIKKRNPRIVSGDFETALKNYFTTTIFIAVDVLSPTFNE